MRRAQLSLTAPAVSAAGVPIPTLSKTKFCADLESRGIASCGCRTEPAIPHRVSGQTRLRRATLPTLSKSSDLRPIAVRQSAPSGATVPHQANRRFASYRAGGQRRRRTYSHFKQNEVLRRLGVKRHCLLRVQGGARNPSPRQRSNAASPRNSSHFKQVVRLAPHCRRQSSSVRRNPSPPSKPQVCAHKFLPISPDFHSPVFAATAPSASTAYFSGSARSMYTAIGSPGCKTDSLPCMIFARYSLPS